MGRQWPFQRTYQHICIHELQGGNVRGKTEKKESIKPDFVLKNRLQSAHRTCICKGENLASGRFLRCSVYLSLRTPLSIMLFNRF